ncbi:MAG: hypothetical protein N2596_00405 [Syntrophorhabdaceae bacterium]|nr:hypothetical protein [Syntrophorhabdaceae bacterium]
MKRILILIVLACFFSMIFNQFGYTESSVSLETYQRETERRGEYMLFDLAVLRPLGIAACAIGTAGFIVSLPFVAFSGGFDTAVDEFLKKPGRFTFERQLGDMNFTYCLLVILYIQYSSF